MEEALRPHRAPPARGGSPLNARGVVLAFVTAMLVLFRGSGALSATNSARPYQRIADVFHVEKLAGAAVPQDAPQQPARDLAATGGGHPAQE
jgi:hypothetical protein